MIQAATCPTVWGIFLQLTLGPSVSTEHCFNTAICPLVTHVHPCPSLVTAIGQLLSLSTITQRVKGKKIIHSSLLVAGVPSSMIIIIQWGLKPNFLNLMWILSLLVFPDTGVFRTFKHVANQARWSVTDRYSVNYPPRHSCFGHIGSVHTVCPMVFRLWHGKLNTLLATRPSIHWFANIVSPALRVTGLLESVPAVLG